MGFIGFLILFPFVMAAVLTVTKNNTARKAMVYLSGGVIMAASIIFAVSRLWLWNGVAMSYLKESEFVHITNYVMLAIEAFLMVLIVILSIKHKKYISIYIYSKICYNI